MCPGCGVELPACEGSTDPYGGASAACWARYGQLLTREFSSPEHFAAHRLSVDAYMAQHPSRISRAAVQSVWIHLAGLCLVLERKMLPKDVGRMLTRFVHREFAWLTPPPIAAGTLTAAAIADSPPEHHLALVDRWAREVWSHWSPHHSAVRALVDRGSSPA